MSAVDFRDLLTEKAGSRSLGSDFRTFQRVDVGDYSLSIQASAMHYSAPRLTLDEPRQYERWEVAAFEKKDGAKDVWMTPETHPEVFDGLAVASEWERGTNGVGGYLLTRDVQALYDRCAALASTREEG